jgi:hypothetical protein
MCIAMNTGSAYRANTNKAFLLYVTYDFEPV